MARPGIESIVNPSGSFAWAARADCGLTGRKIIVDTYGGAARHGGGGFSGKDPSKVDRSAAYFAATSPARSCAGIAKRVEIQVVYAIGEAQPVSVKSTRSALATRAPRRSMCRSTSGPAAIIERLDLLRRSIARPRTTATSAAPDWPGKAVNGHGRPDPGARLARPAVTRGPTRTAVDLTPRRTRPRLQASPARPPAPAGPSSFTRVLKTLRNYLLLFSALAIALLALYLVVATRWSYAPGERAGYVQKFSKKGWVCKTWEGEIAMANLPGAMPEVFAFTVRDEAVAAQTNAQLGARVVLG